MQVPNIENGKVCDFKVVGMNKRQHLPPLRLKNKERRSREYLSPSEIDRLMAAAKGLGRHGHRDSTMVLIAYRHGLRVSELISLGWSQVNLQQGQIHVNRLKGGMASTHPLAGIEIRALRKVQRDYTETQFVFVTERGSPMTSSTFRKIVARAGEAAKIGLPVHPHMLRHSTGFKLANDGRDTRSIQHYLGHRNIQHTVRYTEMSANRFKGFWAD